MKWQTDGTTSEIDGQNSPTDNLTKTKETTENATVNESTSQSFLLPVTSNMNESNSTEDSNSNNSNTKQSVNNNNGSSSTQKSTEVTNTSKDNEFKSTSEALIRKLLQIASPRLDAKIVSVLLLDGKY